MRSYDTQNNASQPRRAILVGVALHGQPGFVVEEHLDELEELAATAGVEVVERAVQRRQSPDAATFIGRGKAEAIGAAVAAAGADLVIFDDDLTASQVKNLEKHVDCQVMDRSALILEIFNLRAKTREARTQVELAQLNYMLPRLTRRWQHLSRQVGGIGVRGGEGEKQLEADRRILRQRIRRLERELEKIERTRAIQRRGRRGAVQVSIAGYTNAGKSTLFNRLTDAGALAEDKLFATLDSKLRRGAVEPGRVLVFADTVGFIRKLPHHLVSSFRSTLGEISAADLVVHVVDRSHPFWEDHMEVAEAVLADLGVEPERIVRVFNKSDLIGGGGDAHGVAAGGGDGHPAQAGESGFPAGGDGHPLRAAEFEGSGGGDGGAFRSQPARDGRGIWISALTGAGLDELKAELARRAERLAAGGLDRDGDRAAAPASGPAPEDDPWAWLDAPFDREPSPAAER